MRFYSDGTKYFDAWVEQGTTSYTNQLFPITTNGNLLFEYYENAAGNVANFTNFARVSNSVSPATNQTLCAGGTVTQLTGTNTATDAPVSSDATLVIAYQWQSSPDSLTWTDITGATGQSYTPPATVGTFYYRRTANVSKNNTDKTGASTIIAVNVADRSNVVRVIIRPTPTATIAVPATVCQNGTAVATFTNPQTRSVTITYKIGSGTNQTINVAANTTATVPVTTTTAGTFTYTLVSVQYQSVPTCSTSVTGSAAVIVRPLPNGTISAPAICQGQVAKITFTATAGTGPYNLAINTQTYNGVVSGAAFNANPAPSGTTIYNLTQITDANGCVNTNP